MIKIFKEVPKKTIQEIKVLRETNNFKQYTIRIIIKNNLGKMNRATANKIYLKLTVKKVSSFLKYNKKRILLIILMHQTLNKKIQKNLNKTVLKNSFKSIQIKYYKKNL